jgi:hypothetical protein
MPLWPHSVILEAIKALFGLGLLAAGWFVGQKIIANWDLRKKQQELDISTAVQFQQLYGELKEVGRLWRESQKPEASRIRLPKELCWSLLAKGANAESKYEAVAMKLASERVLSRSELAALGLFRQACQQLRQSIRENQGVSWSDYGTAYFLFNDLAAEVTCLIASPRPRKSISSEVARENLAAIAKVRGRHWKIAVVLYRQYRKIKGADITPLARLLSEPEKLGLAPATTIANREG